jgi:hypothetical protein
MRPVGAVFAVCVLAGVAAAQEVGPTRFDIIYNPELYRQDSPQAALNSALGAVARDRLDYLVAHLLDPAYVDARLATTQAYFERAAAEQIGSTTAGQALSAQALQNRIRDVGTRLNVRSLADQVRRKLADEPENVRDLKRFARDGQVTESGETATATLKDVPDRALYFKKVGNRWYLENRKEEKPPAKE